MNIVNPWAITLESGLNLCHWLQNWVQISKVRNWSRKQLIFDLSLCASKNWVLLLIYCKRALWWYLIKHLRLEHSPFIDFQVTVKLQSLMFFFHPASPRLGTETSVLIKVSLYTFWTQILNIVVTTSTMGSKKLCSIWLWNFIFQFSRFNLRLLFIFY